jgi:DNA-binding response OmpR family regulator
MRKRRETRFTGSRILLVEDEESLAVGLNYNLSQEGYRVSWISDGKEALDRFRPEAYDLVVLDIMLPRIDGFELAEKIRAQSPQMPILMLTARNSSRDRVRGLELGADDYLTKPFHLKELLLRVHGMLKRKQWYLNATARTPGYRIGGREIRFDDLTVRSGAQCTRLTAHEAMVLKYLIGRKGKVVSRKELLENVWQIRYAVETRTVDNFIARIRKLIEPNPAEPLYIKSIRSAGYVFDDRKQKKWSGRSAAGP